MKDSNYLQLLQSSFKFKIFSSATILAMYSSAGIEGRKSLISALFNKKLAAKVTKTI